MNFFGNKASLKYMDNEALKKSSWWVLVGSEENWDHAIQGATGIWGVRDSPVLKRHWENLKKGDYVLFYAKRPIKGVIGYGQIESKNKQNVPIWPDEQREARVIYPWRFYFNINHILSPKLWNEESLKIEGIPFQAGLSPISNLETIKRIIKVINEKWEEDLEFEFKAKTRKERKISVHDQIKEMIYEIGRGKNFISEKEFPIDGERLDVAWRKVVRGVPTKVFEVQISGGIHQALSKLKHSFDLWNSEPYIVIQQKDMKKVDELLSGTFHEIAHIIRVVETDKIEELYSVLKKSSKIEKGIGL